MTKNVKKSRKTVDKIETPKTKKSNAKVVKKEQKEEKLKINHSSNKKETEKFEMTNEAKKLIYIFGAMIIVILVFYGIANLIIKTQDKDEIINEFIQYDEILATNLLNQNKSEYYVLAYNSKDKYDKYYYYYINSKQASAPYVYNINLENSFNNSFKADHNNLNVTDISELKISSDVLFKIVGGKIVATYDGIENITNKLKEL